MLTTFCLAVALEDYLEPPLLQDGRRVSRTRLEEDITEEQVVRTTQLSGTTTVTHKYGCPYSRHEDIHNLGTRWRLVISLMTRPQ